MFNITLKVYIKALPKSASECIFNFTACTEGNKVVNVEIQEEWRFSFNDDASEDAWGVRACFEAERFERAL